MGYAAVIGLGGYCQVAHQLGRAGIARAPSPFDWLVTPFAALAPVLAARGEGLFAAPSRYDNGLNRGRHVLCGDYGVTSVHDFPLDADGAPILEGAGAVRAKLRHKARQMLAAAAAPGRKLVVRLGGAGHRRDPWPYLRDDAPLPHSQVVALCAALGPICADDFDLLLVVYRGVTALADDASLPANVFVRSLTSPPPPERVWEGSDADWDALLADLPVAPPRRGAAGSPPTAE